jgi:hypothetical protein
MTTDELKDLILAKKKEGEIVFHSIEGLMVAKMEDIIQQPAEGLLWDLNRDMATLLHFASEDNPCWVNDMALSNITEFLVNKVNEITEERDVWKARCEEQEEQLNKEETK